MRLQPLGQEDALEEGTATHFSILAWRIPWTEEPGGLQSQESDTAEVTQHTCIETYKYCFPLLKEEEQKKRGGNW